MDSVGRSLFTGPLAFPSFCMAIISPVLMSISLGLANIMSFRMEVILLAIVFTFLQYFDSSAGIPFIIIFIYSVIISLRNASEASAVYIGA